MNNIDKVLDRVRKFLKLAEHTNSEAEAASAAAQAAKLMEEYQLSEALVRLEDPAVKAEPITEQRLEPDREVAHSKRVAWKETISYAVAESLGVHMFWNNTYVGGRKRSDVRGFGRESAVQTWRYTCQYLWRCIDELADQAWESDGDGGSKKAWKNAFRIGCASRIAERVLEHKQAEEDLRKTAVETALNADDRESLALTVVEKDRNEVDIEYKKRSKGFGKISGIGVVSRYDGYDAGRTAGDKVSLGGGRAGLASGRGMLTE